MWVHAGITEAEQESTREGPPKSTVFTTEEFLSIVHVDPVRKMRRPLSNVPDYLQEDLDQAKADGFSVATDESFEIAGT